MIKLASKVVLIFVLLFSGCSVTLPLATSVRSISGFEIVPSAEYSSIEPGTNLEVSLKSGTILHGKMVGSHRTEPFFEMEVLDQGVRRVEFAAVENIRKSNSGNRRNISAFVLGLVIDIAILGRILSKNALRW